MGLPLLPGQRGSAIADLRRRLARWQAERGLEPVLSAGEEFDEEVAAVVREFQRNRNLPADAEVGPETWQALVEANHVLGDRMLWHSRSVMRGDDVLDLQQRLSKLGFDAGLEDGLFGTHTRAAVMEFQGNVGLDVDGIVGARTLEALQRLHRGHQAAGVSTRVREEMAVRRVARKGLIGLQVMIDASSLDTGLEDGPELTWLLASRWAGWLASHGARPLLSRGPEQRPSTSDTAQLANRSGIDLVLSVGLNSSDNPEAAGCASYYFGSLRFVSAPGRHLAGALQDGMLRGGMGPDCRVHPMTWTLLRETRMPAVVIEPGFATNPGDVARLRDTDVRHALAAALTESLADFLAAYQDDPLT